MLHILKIFWFVIRELAFDSKEEYDFKSKKFNSRKVTLAVMLILSLFLNIWTLMRFYDVSTSYIEAKKSRADETEKIISLGKELADEKLERQKLQSYIQDLEDLHRLRRLKPVQHDKKASSKVIQ